MQRRYSLYVLVGLVGLAAQQSGAQSIFSDNFSYPDGALASVSGGAWASISGTGYPIQVTSYQVAGLACGSGSREDVGRDLGLSYNTGSLYAGFDLSVTAPPVSGGDYFFHFADNGNYYRGRVFVEAPVSTGFRIGLSTDDATTTVLSSDLAVNSTYRVVLRYNLDTRTSDLWINSTEPGTPTLSDAAAATSAVSMTRFILRQGGSGNITGVNLDNLVVSQDFMTAVPEPAGGATLVGLLMLAYGLWRVGRKGNKS